MYTFKQYITESRWLASTNFENDVRDAIHQSIISMPSLEPLIKPGYDIIDDKDGLQNSFFTLVESLQQKLQKIIGDTFKRKYPQIDADSIIFGVTIDFDSINVKGEVHPSENKKTIFINLNIAGSIDSMIAASIKKKTFKGGSWDFEFRKFLLVSIIDEWTKTIVHEATHLAQALSIKMDNYEYYQKKFLPKHFSTPKFRNKEYQHDNAVYLSSTVEIQAHAASVASHVNRRLGNKKALFMVDEFENWLFKQSNMKFKLPVKRSRIDVLLMNVLGQHDEMYERLRYVEKIMNKAPSDLNKFVNTFEEIRAYSAYYIMGAIDKRAMKRFLRDMRRTLKDKVK